MAHKVMVGMARMLSLQSITTLQASLTFERPTNISSTYRTLITSPT